MDIVDKIIAYEQGDLGTEETKELFQELVDSGLAWRLQGYYGRVAQRMIDNGDIFSPDAGHPRDKAKPSFGPVS